MFHARCRFGAINFVAFIVIFMMKLMVSLLVAAIAFAWIQDDDAVELKGVVVFVLAVLAWFIADAFAGIYSMTADTLLLVFAEDCAQTTGPHYASERWVPSFVASLCTFPSFVTSLCTCPRPSWCSGTLAPRLFLVL